MGSKRNKLRSTYIHLINCNCSCKQLQWPLQQPVKNKRQLQQTGNCHNLIAVDSHLLMLYLMLQLIFVEHTADSFVWHNLQLHPDFDQCKMTAQHKMQLPIGLHRTLQLQAELHTEKLQTELHRQLVRFEMHRQQRKFEMHKGLPPTTGLRKALLQTGLHKGLQRSVQHR